MSVLIAILVTAAVIGFIALIAYFDSKQVLNFGKAQTTPSSLRAGQ